MFEGTAIEGHSTIFKEIVADLAMLEVKYDGEDLRSILLCSLPTSYTTFRDAIFYSCDIFKIDEVYDAYYRRRR